MRKVLITSALLLPLAAYASPALDTLFAEYTQAGAKDFSAEIGKAFFYQERKDEATGEMRACTTCHHKDLTQEGKHASTGKVIKPLAPSANPQRLTDLAEINKWLKRNCKWTVGRECTAQEKADILTFLKSQ